MLIYILIGIMVMTGFEMSEGKDYLQEDKFFKKVKVYLFGVMSWPALVIVLICDIAKALETISKTLGK